MQFKSDLQRQHAITMLRHLMGEKEMAFEQRPGSASLFQNRKKEKPNQPDFKGTGVLQVENKLVTIEFAAWTKFSEKAGDWYSLSMKTTEVKDNPDMDKAFLEDDAEIQH